MEKENLGKRIYREFFDIRREEWPAVLSMSLFFFMVIATFWVLKPLKRGLLVNFYQDAPLTLMGFTFAGAEVEQLAKVLNMVVVYGIVIGFTMLSRKFKRHNLNLILSSVFAVLFIIFANLMRQPEAGTAWSFYVLGDMFNSTFVTFFWAYSNDIFTSEQAKRSYGLVGLGGIIGGIVGSTVVVQYVTLLGRSTLLYLCLIPLVVIVAIGYYVNYQAPDRSDDEAEEEEPCAEGKYCNAIWAGARLVFNSKYLLAIVGIIGLYEMVSNIVDFQLSAVIATEVAGALNKDAYFGFVGQITSIVSLIVQLFLTSLVMRRFGVGVALLFLPMALLMGTVGFVLVPSLIFVTIMSASDNSLNYSINQSAKEALYTPTTQDEKYKAKSFIDMFVQRAAKVLAVVLNLVVAAYVGMGNVRWLSIAVFIILVFWILVVRYAGREFDMKAAEQHEV